MKKILIITSHYFPGYKAGGPIKSILSICSSLQNNFDITVLTSNYDLGEVVPYLGIISNQEVNIDNYKVIYLSKINFKNIKKNIKLIEPDIIYLNSFFSSLTQIVLLLKKFKLISSEIILAPRGELSFGALSIKPNKKKIYIKAMKLLNVYKESIIFHSTDQIETNDIKKLFSNEIYCIPNLISNKHKTLTIASKKENELRIVFLSRISKKKNLLYALEILINNIYDGKIIFDIYGTLEDENYWNKCKDIISNTNKNMIVKYKGLVEPKDVSHVLSRYNVFLLPTKNENFGHAIVEAMQCGVVPIISNQTPWNDLSKFDAGFSLDLQDANSFKNAISKILNFSDNDFKKMSENVKKYINLKIDNSDLTNKYIQMFSEG
jgi:glycosyltransferase involved in cell wall biosynthesis